MCNLFRFSPTCVICVICGYEHLPKPIEPENLVTSIAAALVRDLLSVSFVGSSLTYSGGRVDGQADCYRYGYVARLTPATVCQQPKTQNYAHDRNQRTGRCCK